MLFFFFFSQPVNYIQTIERKFKALEDELITLHRHLNLKKNKKKTCLIDIKQLSCYSLWFILQGMRRSMYAAALVGGSTGSRIVVEAVRGSFGGFCSGRDSK